MNKRISKLLFPVMLWLIPITATVWVYGFSINWLSDKIYEGTSKSFLAQSLQAAPHLRNLPLTKESVGSLAPSVKPHSK